MRIENSATMDTLPSLASHKRTLDEVPSDQEKGFKRSRLRDEVEDSSTGDADHDQILDELPPVSSRVQRYCGIDKTRHSVLPNTFSIQYTSHALYLPLLASEIRLLKVYAGENDEPLRACLIHTPLSAVVDR